MMAHVYAREGEVRKVAVHLKKVLEVMSTSVCTGLNPFNFIRKHFLQICLCLGAQLLSERTVVLAAIKDACAWQYNARGRCLVQKL